MLTLGVPTLRRYDLLELLITTAKEGERKPDEYVVVDNGGSLGQRWWLGDVKVVTPGKNLGVAGGWNEIMRQSTGDHVLIVGDDVRLHKDTLVEMERVALGGAGFVRSGHAPAFSCFLLARWLFEKVGPFDERFWPAYFEDNDYHRRMKLLGYDFATAPVSYDHVGSATIKSFSEAEMSTHHARFEANKQKYIAKWGGPPHAEVFTVPFNGRGQG